MKSKAARETLSDRELALRFGADRLCLWCSCGSARCRRARCCRGDVHDCAGRIADWLKAVDAERLARPNFESVEMLVRTPQDLRAYRAWRRAMGV